VRNNTIVFLCFAVPRSEESMMGVFEKIAKHG